jgi:hypothetical protein
MMNLGKLAIIPGVIIAISGMVFHLQGRAIVGPQSSFMYSNPDWIDYGIILITIGLAIIGIGVFWYKKSSKSHAR